MTAISFLRDRPEFADTLADRAWHAWWTDSGVTLDAYRAHLTPMLAGDGVPFGLVAHEGDRYVGSALVIESDLEAGPQLTPWIAALWVEPERRRQGVAATLIEAAQAEAARLGHPTCYLCTVPDNVPYYLRRRARLLERDVDGLDVLVM